MKISQKQLESENSITEKPASKPEQFTTPRQPGAKLIMGTDKRGETTTYIKSEHGFYDEAVFRFAMDNEIQLIDNLKEALEKRSASNRVLTYREADTLARGRCEGLKDEDSFIFKALFMFYGLITEGAVDCNVNTWTLRNEYSRGVAWVSTYRNKVTPERLKKATDRMHAILTDLSEMNVPAWPSEVDKGFPVEICKPEYMTFDQFQKSIKSALNITQKEQWKGEKLLFT